MLVKQKQFSRCFVETRFGHYDLKDAVWTPYHGSRDTGKLTGIVVMGGRTKREGHISEFENQSGTVQSFDFVSVRDIPEDSPLPPCFNLCSL